MDDYSEDTDKHSAAQSALNNCIEAHTLMGNFRPPEGTVDALAAAQIHATLSLADVQIGIARLQSMVATELNAASMFTVTGTLDKDYPLTQVIRDGLLEHLNNREACTWR